MTRKSASWFERKSLSDDEPLEASARSQRAENDWKAPSRPSTSCALGVPAEAADCAISSVRNAERPSSRVLLDEIGLAFCENAVFAMSVAAARMSREPTAER